jgi:hypothetical protein
MALSIPREETIFGRLEAPDPRDFDHLMQAPRTPWSYLLTERIWTAGPITDQGSRPHCVGHAWRQFLEASPVRRGKRQLPLSEEIYDQAQQVDEWPGPPPPYAGTSVRAGAKVLQRLGLIREYMWAPDVDTLRKFVLGRGPVVVGTAWYAGMTHPTKRGKDVWLEPTSGYEGGHAYVLIGYSRRRHAFRCVNSWGRGWADNGRAWIKLETLGHLIFMQNGEACSAIELE